MGILTYAPFFIVLLVTGVHGNLKISSHLTTVVFLIWISTYLTTGVLLIWFGTFLMTVVLIKIITYLMILVYFI